MRNVNQQTAAGRGRPASLDGKFLDAFRSKITEKLPNRAATSGSPDSPGAMLERLKKLTR